RGRDALARGTHERVDRARPPDEPAHRREPGRERLSAAGRRLADRAGRAALELTRRSASGAPALDEPELRRRLGRAVLAVRLADAATRELSEGALRVEARVADPPARDHRAGAPEPPATVEIDGPVARDRSVDEIEDGDQRRVRGRRA